MFAHCQFLAAEDTPLIHQESIKILENINPVRAFRSGGHSQQEGRSEMIEKGAV